MMGGRNTVRVWLVVSGIALSGCGLSSNHSKDFQCTAVLGTPCTTIADADGTNRAKASQVTPKNGNSVRPYDPQPRGGMFAWSKGRTKGIQNANQPRIGLGSNARNLPTSRYNAAAQRVPEQLGTLWIASYLDDDGILHDASYVHFVIQEAGWAGVH